VGRRGEMLVTDKREEKGRLGVRKNFRKNFLGVDRAGLLRRREKEERGQTKALGPEGERERNPLVRY